MKSPCELNIEPSGYVSHGVSQNAAIEAVTLFCITTADYQEEEEEIIILITHKELNTYDDRRSLSIYISYIGFIVPIT